MTQEKVENRTLDRDDMAALARVHASAGVHLIECDLDEAELSELDLAGWRFERCTLRRAEFTKARLERTQWQSCRAPLASFFAADLTDAVFQSCGSSTPISKKA
jgi:fluoroquinolone resistance protein